MSRKSIRTRRKPRVSYHDLSDSDDFEFMTQQQSSRPSRAARRNQTYRESSDDESSADEDDDDDVSSSSTPDVEPAPKPSRATRQSQPKPMLPPKFDSHLSARQNILKRQREAGASSFSFSTYKQSKFQRTDPGAKVMVEIKASEPEPASTIKIPPWQELPYQVLKNIMTFASYPLYHQASRSSSSIQWLCETSMLCRSFHEACMAALLYSPPLYPSRRAHGLIALLRQSRNRPIIEYRSKIHRLDIEVKQLLVKKSGIDLEILLNQTPLLRELRLYSNYDDLNTVIWAQRGATKSKWSYPDRLFDLLQEKNIALNSFEWNGRFPSAIEALEIAAKVHSQPSFSRLKEVAFLNFSMPDKATPTDISRAHSLFESALSQLPELRRLTMRACPMVGPALISMLPGSLHHLEISNCLYLDSPALQAFLVTGGAHLTSLRLSGNQSMSLEFMAVLKTLCPRLQDLRIDLLYIDPTSYNDREPLYDELLPSGPPTWPEDLTNIALDNLRQLSAEDAEGLLASLVDAAKDLQSLKRIDIKAILNGSSWRDRAELRRKWLPKLQEVFLNTSEPPKEPSRRQPISSMMATQARSSKQRQSQRIATNLLNKASSTDASDSDSAASSTSKHARCDFVNLIISDQRPAQDQYREDDFLDDEPSGDEEWNGRDTDPTLSTRYAW
ncbi:hypothetical protein B0A52_10191 [Exophiala mesophila]|uniref:Uncharacterized protein n=1 Tax=Exophiala mesophila TaxID=212818 RepID=A0A438MT65_EXOME|nr:hypothetical protein B0A52_10191 [Exophiala mesophila]